MVLDELDGMGYDHEPYHEDAGNVTLKYKKKRGERVFYP